MKKLLCSLFALSAVSTAMAQEVNIKLLGTSDVHGRIVPWSYGADVEDKSGSYAQIATYVKDVRKNNKNVVLRSKTTKSMCSQKIKNITKITQFQKY